MKLNNLLDINKLEQHIVDGNVTKRNHSTLPLVVYNYTPKVQFDKLWDDVLILTRGLVVNTITDEVVARPFPKFFNLAELIKPPSGAYRVFDKLDGSLGIGITPGVIATRGSFESEQANAAMKIWNDKYKDVVWPEGYTPLWEIIHPTSRVVVDYSGLEDLVLLALVNITSGMCLYPTDTLMGDWWPGPKVREFNNMDYQNPPFRSNAEGYVIVFEDGTRVKIKYDEYVQLHRIVTGLNEKTILEDYCIAGRSLNELRIIPDELYKWAINTALKFYSRADSIRDEIKKIYDKAPKETRKDFAFYASQYPLYASTLFSMLDNQQDKINNNIWKIVKNEN